MSIMKSTYFIIPCKTDPTKNYLLNWKKNKSISLKGLLKDYFTFTDTQG